jgi:acetyl-CoA C-acetyltransferase
MVPLLIAGDLARMAALDAGYDVKASGVTLDRFCGSGTEMMPLRSGGGKGSPFLDNDNLRLRAVHPQSHQGVCADHAIKNGHFDKSLITVYKTDGTVALDHEEFPRPQTTREGLGQLKPSFEAIIIERM